MMRRPLIAMITAAAVAVPLSAPPAAAGSASRVSEVGLGDAAEDVWLWSEGTSSWELWGRKADADVLSATVKHGEKVIRVVLTFDNLRKKRPAAYLAKIKTKKMVRSAWVEAGPGPGWGGEHKLLKGADEVPANGFEHDIDYQEDKVVMRLPRKLFNGPAWIKVMMRNDLTGNRLFTDNPHNNSATPVYTPRIDAP